MAGQKGRDVLIKIDISGTYTTIGGMRSKSIDLDDSSVDITDSDSAGRWRELLAAAGVKTASISGQGVFKDSTGENAILTHWNAGTFPNMQFVVPGLGTFQGAFKPKISYQGGHDGEAQFSATFDSAGEITFS